MDHSSTHNMPSTRVGTTSGFIVSVFANIDSNDLSKTAVLSVVGAVVGFLTTLLLKWLVRKFKDVSGK